MNITVHHPLSNKGAAELQSRVSQVHINAVFSFVDNLTCPKSQKEALFLALLEKRKK